MSEKNICMKCKKTGDKKAIPYKIIKDTDGLSVKFVGQLCEQCMAELNDGPPKTDSTDEEQKEN